MGEWNAWAGRAGDGMVDFGTSLARSHPHLNMPGGCEMEVHDAQAVPGM